MDSIVALRELFRLFREHDGPVTISFGGDRLEPEDIAILRDVAESLGFRFVVAPTDDD